MKKLFWVTRVLIFYVGIMVATVFFGALTPVLFLFSDKIRYFVITRWSHFFIAWAKKILGLKYRIKGQAPQGKDSKQGIVVVSNHQSAWETVFMQTHFPPQSWILKKELLGIPFFGWGLRLLKPVAIKRQNKGTYQQVIKDGLLCLQTGRWVVIFPEGTRVLPDRYHRFAKGGAGLAIAAQCPILPIAHNAGRLWPRGWWIKSPGTITLSIGPLLRPKPEESAQALMDRAESWIRQEMQKIG